MRRHRPTRSGPASACLVALLLAVLLPSSAAPGESLVERDRRLLDAAFAAMPGQRPGHPDLYVIGLAGDGHEDVFRNEIAWLDTLANARMGAGGRVVRLVNHADSLGTVPRPLATLDSLRTALAHAGAAMDRDEDLLLLFLTTHGTENHELVLRLYPVVDARITPEQLRAALDDAGIRRRVVVVSACYAGGFLPALGDPGTLAIAAARHDRTSFGCGSAASLTYFGRAWLVEGLNRRPDFIEAFVQAAEAVARRERAEDYPASLPQIAVGERIRAPLQQWQAGLPPSQPLPDPYPEPPPSAAAVDRGKAGASR
jgi:hypothetical protein